MSDRFERFTPRTRKALQYAQEEAVRLQHSYIGTEHLLLGLLRVQDGVAARVLDAVGIRLPEVRSGVELVIGRGEQPGVGNIGLTPRAKKVLELTVDEANQLGHVYVGTEHLLLGLVREGEGVAVGVLESLGVGANQVRAQITHILNDSGYAQPRRPQQLGQVAMEALDEAELAAAWFQHPLVEPDHLLLGLLRAQSGAAARALRDAGITLERAAQHVLTGRGYGGQPARGSAEYSAATQAVLDHAGQSALDANRPHASTADLLLALPDEVLSPLVPDLAALRGAVGQPNEEP